MSRFFLFFVVFTLFLQQIHGVMALGPSGQISKPKHVINTSDSPSPTMPTPPLSMPTPAPKENQPVETDTEEEEDSLPGKEITYTVVQGDTLSELAEKYLGSWKKYTEIVELNKEKYPSLAKNPDLIHIGWKLKIMADESADSEEGGTDCSNEVGTTVAGDQTADSPSPAPANAAPSTANRPTPPPVAAPPSANPPSPSPVAAPPSANLPSPPPVAAPPSAKPTSTGNVTNAFNSPLPPEPLPAQQAYENALGSIGKMKNLLRHERNENYTCSFDQTFKAAKGLFRSGNDHMFPGWELITPIDEFCDGGKNDLYELQKQLLDSHKNLEKVTNDARKNWTSERKILLDKASDEARACAERFKQAWEKFVVIWRREENTSEAYTRNEGHLSPNWFLILNLRILLGDCPK
ncbi:MAG: LysM peptidoglycan-binding domain-containing protein [Candidatus Riflebacteria bacterium]|nr:LysM peptidoglycan-binding domain-containing protein [Candidatus Riflebacteria bacterium]